MLVLNRKNLKLVEVKAEVVVRVRVEANLEIKKNNEKTNYNNYNVFSGKR